MPDLAEIVREIDRLAVGRPIGKLQDLRKQIRGLKRKPSQNVFEYPNHTNWAHHTGGFDELQFNLGIDEPFDQGNFRYGIALSLQPNRSLPSVEPLFPKIALLNDYLREHSAQLADLWMWHYEDGQCSSLRRPTAIEPKLAKSGVFLFVGGLGNAATPNYEAVLDTLDRLLPLWKFVESHSRLVDVPTVTEETLRLGLPVRPTRTFANLAERRLSVDLRHNALQTSLYHELVEEHGYECVASEHEPFGGGLIDVIVKKQGLRLLFEIKTASTARGCVREAVGQLLDYGCWPGCPPVNGLIVVGEPPLDRATARYLEELNRKFPAPLSYRQVSLSSD